MQVALDALQLTLHVPAQLPVERAQRLVHQEHARVEDERTRERDPLLLATGELAWKAALVAREPHQLERLADPAPDVGGGHLPHLERERDVLGDLEVREHSVALEDHAEVALLRRKRGDIDAVDRDRAPARMDEARHHHERRRLARTARSQQREERSGGDGHADVADRHHRPEELGQPL